MQSKTEVEQTPEEKIALFSITIDDKKEKISFFVADKDGETSIDVDLSSVNENQYIPVSTNDGQYVCIKRNGKCYVYVPYDHSEVNALVLISDKFINGKYYGFIKTIGDITFEQGEELDLGRTELFELEGKPLDLDSDEKLVVGFIEVGESDKKEWGKAYIYDIADGKVQDLREVELEQLNTLAEDRILHFKTNIIGLPAISFERNEYSELQIVTAAGNLRFCSFFGKVSKELSSDKYFVYGGEVNLNVPLPPDTPEVTSNSGVKNRAAHFSNITNRTPVGSGLTLNDLTTPKRTLSTSFALMMEPYFSSVIKRTPLVGSGLTLKDLSETQLTSAVRTSVFATPATSVSKRNSMRDSLKQTPTAKTPSTASTAYSTASLTTPASSVRSTVLETPTPSERKENESTEKQLSTGNNMKNSTATPATSGSATSSHQTPATKLVPQNPLIEAITQKVEKEFIQPKKGKGQDDPSRVMVHFDISINTQDSSSKIVFEDNKLPEKRIEFLVDLKKLDDNNIIICASDVLDRTIMFTSYKGNICAHVLGGNEREDIFCGTYTWNFYHGDTEITKENLFTIYTRDIVKSPVKQSTGAATQEEFIEIELRPTQEADPKLQNFIKLFVGEEKSADKTTHRGRLRAKKVEESEEVRKEFTTALTNSLNKMPAFKNFISTSTKEQQEQFISEAMHKMHEEGIFNKRGKFSYLGRKGSFSQFIGELAHAICKVLCGAFEAWNDLRTGRVQLEVTDVKAVKQDLTDHREKLDKLFGDIAEQVSKNKQSAAKGQ